MPENNTFPLELNERLQDEACAMLCHEAFAKQLEALKEKKRAGETRMPFSFLIPGKATKAPFEVSAEGGALQDVEARLTRAEHIRSWATTCVREQLELYLLGASADYQSFHGMLHLVQRWQSTTDGLQELLIAFAREAKVVVAQLEENPNAPVGQLEPLRKTVGSLTSVGGRNQALVDEFSQISKGRLPAEALLPAAPNLPSLAWLEPLFRKGAVAAAKELRAAEAAARELSKDLKPRAQAKRAVIEAECSKGMSVYLNRYWEQLRAHTRQYCQHASAEPEQFLKVLEERHRIVESRRQRTMETNSPFSIAR